LSQSRCFADNGLPYFGKRRALSSAAREVEAISPMDRQEVETAIEAANVALAGRRRREASSFASIELREADSTPAEWEIIAAGIVGVFAVVAVLVAWLY
jgi:hypothetical protein